MDEEKRTEFLDDCTALVECIRVLQEKGVESVDEVGVTLKAEIFDRCFPGVEWEKVKDMTGQPIGLRTKSAQYRGFEFAAVELEGDEP